MQITVSKEYLAFLFILWIAPTVSSVWGGPIWITISFLALFLIYAGHEFVHAWICEINGVAIDQISLQPGGGHHITFSRPESDKVYGDILLAGAAYDSILFAISALSSIMYGFLTNEVTPVTFGCSLIILIIFNLAWPNSDWRQYRSLTTRA